MTIEESAIRAIANEEANSVLEKKLQILKIDLAESSLSDPTHNLVFLLESAGYQQADIAGISDKTGSTAYISSESLELAVGVDEKIPHRKKGEKKCTLDVRVSAKYSANIAIIKECSVDLHEVQSEGLITRKIDSEMPKSKLNEFSISSILAKEGYTPFKGNSYIVVPEGARMFVKGYSESFNGKYDVLEGQKVHASGKLNINGDFLIYMDKDLKSVNIPAETDIDTNFKVNPAEVKDIESGGTPKYTRLPVKISLDLANAVSVMGDYQEKSYGLYRKWVIEEVTNAKGEEIRAQLNLSIGEPQYKDKESISVLAHLAKDRINEIN